MKSALVTLSLIVLAVICFFVLVDPQKRAPAASKAATNGIPGRVFTDPVSALAGLQVMGPVFLDGYRVGLVPLVVNGVTNLLLTAQKVQ